MNGPFVHQLNRGGLEQILATQRLRASEARQIAGGQEAIRAHVGNFEEVAARMNWLMRPDAKQLYIEFETARLIDKGIPPRSAQWSGLEYLPIRVLRVMNGLGTQVR